MPPSPPAARDAMPALFELLRDEPDPSVRVVLGHFLFVYVHPYPDGNGRLGRFLMKPHADGGGVSLDRHPRGAPVSTWPR